MAQIGIIGYFKDTFSVHFDSFALKLDKPETFKISFQYILDRRVKSQNVLKNELELKKS